MPSTMVLDKAAFSMYTTGRPEEIWGRGGSENLGTGKVGMSNFLVIHEMSIMSITQI